MNKLLSIAKHVSRFEAVDISYFKDDEEHLIYENQSTSDQQELVNILEEIKYTYAPDKIILTTKKKQGDDFVAGAKQTVDTVEPANPSSLEGMPQDQLNDVKAYMIKQLEKDLQKMEKKSEWLESQNERLKEENFKLQKENQLKDEVHAIEDRKKEIEQSNGLAGVMEKVGENPVLANLAAVAVSRLMGVDMSAGQLPSANANVSFDGSDNEVIAETEKWLLSKDDQYQKEFFILVQLLAQNEELLGQLLSNFRKPTDQEVDYE
ncbi:hypothetical protein [Persicobacter diffluens]|uniref:Uncharacterized protein n=1 Tax=Persicobacter diffluens TaxID=981 RepID=A0AAN4W3C4_9BACT|nr:hypothetical protein PEDI_55160 [Persicobacter diffluens]